MSKRYFLKFTEARTDLVVESGPVMVIKMNFNEGVAGSGYLRKRDALKWAAMINAAAGKTIALYAGSKG